jgi:di/tricarboxylate transporter
MWLASTVCAVFAALALWHFRMAMTIGSDESAAVPSLRGKPLFTPSRASTIAVGVVLLLFALLVLATAGIVRPRLPQPVLTWLSYGLAMGLALRAIGEFKYVGFFKSVRGTHFARMDTLVYSPLCALLSAGVATVAARHAT